MYLLFFHDILIPEFGTEYCQFKDYAPSQQAVNQDFLAVFFWFTV